MFRPNSLGVLTSLFLAMLGTTASNAPAQRGGQRGMQSGHVAPGHAPGMSLSRPYRQEGAYAREGAEIDAHRHPAPNHSQHIPPPRPQSYTRGAASDHYGSRRGLHHHPDRNGLGIYLSVPYGASYTPYYGYRYGYGYAPYGQSLYGYPGGFVASPYGYGIPGNYGANYGSAMVYNFSIPGAAGAQMAPAANDPRDLLRDRWELDQQVDRRAPAVIPPQADLAASEDVPAVIATTAAAAPFQLQAEQAFRNRDFREADRQVAHALLDDKSNGKVMLFAAQVKFALEDYAAAAEFIRQATHALPKADWGFVVQNYKRFYNGQDFVQQMDQLVKFTREHPDERWGQFVHGYQYQYLGYVESARKRLTQAVALAPDDPLPAEFLALLPAVAPPSSPLPDGVVPSVETLPAPQETLRDESSAPNGLPVPNGSPLPIGPPRPMIQESTLPE